MLRTPKLGPEPLRSCLDSREETQLQGYGSDALKPGVLDCPIAPGLTRHAGPGKGEQHLTWHRYCLNYRYYLLPVALGNRKGVLARPRAGIGHGKADLMEGAKHGPSALRGGGKCLLTFAE